MVTNITYVAEDRILKYDAASENLRDQIYTKTASLPYSLAQRI